MALKLSDVAALMNYAMQRNGVYTFLWHNPSGLTPQQVIALLGTDAGTFVTFKQDLEAAIARILPSLTLLADLHSLTVNQDGTVTIGS